MSGLICSSVERRCLDIAPEADKKLTPRAMLRAACCRGLGGAARCARPLQSSIRAPATRSLCTETPRRPNRAFEGFFPKPRQRSGAEKESEKLLEHLAEMILVSLS